MPEMTHCLLFVAKLRPGTEVGEIKNQFNNIRKNFLVQYRKYKSSFHSGMGEDEVGLLAKYHIIIFVDN